MSRTSTAIRCQFHGCPSSGDRLTRAVSIGLPFGDFSIACCAKHEAQLRELTGTEDREPWPAQTPDDRLRVA